MTEQRPIPGYLRYAARADGQIIRLVRGPRGHAPGPVCQWLAKVGYLMVTLREAGVRRKEYVHRLVCLAFHGPAPSAQHEVAHRDGTRTNNAEDNLRWATRQENCADAAAHGTRLRGERQNGARLTADAVREIRSMAKDGMLHKDIAARFGVHKGNVGHIVRRDTWKHV